MLNGTCAHSQAQRVSIVQSMIENVIKIVRSKNAIEKHNKKHDSKVRFKCVINRGDSQVRSTGATHKCDQQVRLTSVINRCNSQVRLKMQLSRESKVCKLAKFKSSQVRKFVLKKHQKIQKTLLNESGQFENEWSTIN